MFLPGIGFSQERQPNGILLLNQNALKIKLPYIDLTHNGKFTFQNKLNLNFEISFWEPNYFGYLGKIILNDSLEFLLTYNTYAKNDTTFVQLVINKTKTAINLPFSKEVLHRGNWFNFEFIFDVKLKKLSIITKYANKTIIDIPYKKLNNIDIIFGTKISDIDFTTFALRKLKINTDINDKNGKEYFWDFANIEDSESNDLINNKTISLTNCQQISDYSFKWRKLTEIKTNGYSSFSFDDKNGKILIIDDSKLNIYDLQSNNNKKIAAKITVSDFKTYYDTLTQDLYAFHRGGGEVSVFDWKKETWSKIDNSRNSSSFYTHSLFVNPLDSSLNMFGGYGFYTFHNHFQKYDFTTKHWNIISFGGSRIEPRKCISRWLSKTDSTMINYAGYGNSTGEQSNGVKYYHDLWELNLKSANFTKIDSLKLDSEKPSYKLFYYDNKNDEYFFLAPQSYFVDPKSMKGSETVIDFYKSSGNNFSELTLINSFTINKKLIILEAFYNRKTNEIIALYKNDSKYNITYEIHSIFYPMKQNVPNLAENIYLEFLINYWYFHLLVITIFLGIYYLSKKKKTYKTADRIINVIKDNEIEKEAKYSIYLFGDFQFFDKNLDDKTYLISAKLTEMFMLIFFHTFKLVSTNGTSGITTEKLSSILWPNMANGHLKNIRNVTINKLRGILDAISDVQIIYNNGFWKIEANNTQIDYIDMLALLKSCETNQLTSLINIAKRGKILNNLGYDWLEPIKVATDNVIIDFLIEKLSKIQDNGTLLQIAETILSIDSVNEIALKAKLQILKSEGKRTAVQNVYDNFIKEYESLYDEKYEKSLKDILS